MAVLARTRRGGAAAPPAVVLPCVAVAAAFGELAGSVLTPGERKGRALRDVGTDRNPSERRHAMRNRWLAPAGLAAAALVVAACGSSTSSGGSGTSPPAHASSSTLDAGTVNGAKVLVNGKGLTVYWFALDTANKSNCNGSCVQYWPPVPGPATAMSGVNGTLGVITRSNGAKQATWNGHPLYTYISDTAPGTAKGNGLNLSGGVWHDIVLSGAAAPAASQSSSGGGGYGY